MLMNLNLFMNKKRNMKNVFLYTVTAAFLALSCNAVKMEAPLKYGTLSISLSGESGLDVLTKGELSAADAADYNIAVYNNVDCNGYAAYGPCKYSELGTDPILLQEGTYYVWAESCSSDVSQEGNGCVRLEGKSAEGVSVSAGFAAETSVICTVANAKVTVLFDAESLSGKFKNNDLTVTLTCADRDPLTAEYTAGDEVFWFNADTELTYTVEGTSALTGEGVEGRGTIDALSAGSHIQLTIKAQSSQGLLELSSSVVQAVDKNENSNINSEFNPYQDKIN